MTMLTKKTVVLAKVEGTYGADPTLAAGDDAVEAYEFTPPVINADMKERNPGNDDLSMYGELRGKTSNDFQVIANLRGSGAAGTAPRRSPLYKACGFEETIVSSTSVAYTPRSSSKESCAIKAYIDGIIHLLLGCVGNYQLEAVAGETVKETFDLKAKYALPTDGTIVSPTFDSTVPQIAKSVVMTIGSYSAILEKFTLNMNNTVAERPDQNETEGVKGFVITGRNPEGTIMIEAVLRATSNADFLSYFHNTTVKDISFVLGGTAGNIATITLPKIYLRAPVTGDRDGVRTNELPFQIARNSGDDEVSISFT